MASEVFSLRNRQILDQAAYLPGLDFGQLVGSCAARWNQGSPQMEAAEGGLQVDRQGEAPGFSAAQLEVGFAEPFAVFLEFAAGFALEELVVAERGVVSGVMDVLADAWVASGVQAEPAAVWVVFVVRAEPAAAFVVEAIVVDALMADFVVMYLVWAEPECDLDFGAAAPEVVGWEAPFEALLGVFAVRAVRAVEFEVEGLEVGGLVE